jgi:hypothetical protein
MGINVNANIVGRLFNRAKNVTNQVSNLAETLGGSGNNSAKSPIDQFKTRMSSFARPNLFEVMISNPSGKKVLGTIHQRLSFACYQATIPGMNIATTDKDPGYRSVAYQKIYEDVTLGFYVHGDMKELKVFQDWMQLMIDPSDNHVGYYDDYVSTVEIKNLDRQQKKVLTTTLIDAYPKTLETISLDAGANDDVMKVNVVFTYRHYTQKFGGRQETVGISKGLNDITSVQRKNLTDGIIDKTLTTKQRKEIFDGTVNEVEQEEF